MSDRGSHHGPGSSSFRDFLSRSVHKTNENVRDSMNRSLHSLSKTKVNVRDSMNRSFHGTQRHASHAPRLYLHDPITHPLPPEIVVLDASETDWKLTLEKSTHGLRKTNQTNSDDSKSDAIADIESNLSDDETLSEDSDERIEVSCDILRRSIYEAGKWSEGVIAVEVWVNIDHSRVMVPRGWWRDSSIEVNTQTEAANKLAKKQSIGYIPPNPQDNGTGLANTLLHENPIFNKNTTWKPLSSVKYDSCDKLRCSLLTKAGFGFAAAAPFVFGDHTGVVIYLTRSTVNMEKLRSKPNIAYMNSAADLIGAASQNAELRLKLMHERHEDLVTLRNTVFDNVHGSIIASSEDDIDDAERVNIVISTLKVFFRKFRGGPDKPPPQIPLSECIWVFLGVFVTMLVIAVTSQRIHHLTDGDLLIEMGPLGALMILQFGLSAVPAAQPYNAVFGQMTAAVISMLIASTSVFDLPTKISLSVALSCTCMMALGFTHPPAGAAAVIFSSRRYSWASCGLLLVGNIMAVLMAATWNNMHKNRSYPAYWGLENFTNLLKDTNNLITSPFRYLFSMCSREKTEKKMPAPTK